MKKIRYCWAWGWTHAHTLRVTTRKASSTISHNIKWGTCLPAPYLMHCSLSTSWNLHLCPGHSLSLCLIALPKPTTALLGEKPGYLNSFLSASWARPLEGDATPTEGGSRHTSEVVDNISCSAEVLNCLDPRHPWIDLRHGRIEFLVFPLFNHSKRIIFPLQRIKKDHNYPTGNLWVHHLLNHICTANNANVV